MGYDAMPLGKRFPMFPIVSHLQQSKHPRKLPNDIASYPRAETSVMMQQKPKNSQTNSYLYRVVSSKCSIKMFQITYETIGVVQMTFLRLLSQEAYQNFTYTCINSAAWFNLKTNNHDMAIKLLGENETEFSTEGIKPSVLTDGCKVSQTFSNKFLLHNITSIIPHTHVKHEQDFRF